MIRKLEIISETPPAVWSNPHQDILREWCAKLSPSDLPKALSVNKHWNAALKHPDFGNRFLKLFKDLNICLSKDYQDSWQLFKDAWLSRCEIYVDISGSMGTQKTGFIMNTLIESACSAVEKIVEERKFFLKKMDLFTFDKQCSLEMNAKTNVGLLKSICCVKRTNLLFLSTRLEKRYLYEHNLGRQLTIFIVSDLVYSDKTNRELISSFGTIHKKIGRQKNFKLIFVEIPTESSKKDQGSLPFKSAVKEYIEKEKVDYVSVVEASDQKS